MTIANLSINKIACIKELNIKDKSLKLRLLEMGLVKNTKIKIVYKNKEINVY